MERIKQRCPRLSRIGITTTVPSEVIWAAGMIPVDLNNLFINSTHRDRYIKAAEHAGYPRNVCGWIKGIYGALAVDAGIDTVIGVTQGDCSNTHALMETLQLRNFRAIPFAYPYDRDPETISREIGRLASELGTTLYEAERVRLLLEPLRRKLDRLDEMTWKENRISGQENHLWLVSSSDFNGDWREFEAKLDCFLAEASVRPPFCETVRLAFIGVPAILDDIYEVVEGYGARFVFNEVQRQFSMPERMGGLVQQYRAYTYPYDIFHRLSFITSELELRGVHGVIHYVQSFCHRQIEDLIIRKKINLPVLTIEGDQPGRVDERTRIRLQAFVEMIGDRIKR
jgi:benzoyl-CoA reductase/2-hydroxyglutaryl-CoA dehydratase subunit BcrC/BadD/HgdB